MSNALLTGLRSIQPATRMLRRTPASSFAGLLALYLLVHCAIRLLMWQSLEYDEAEQLLYGQSLALWYSAQPPLYSWLVYCSAQIFGPGVLAISIVKFALLGALYALLYLVACRVVAKPLAAIAAFTPLLSPTFAWESIRMMTHTILMSVAALCILLSLIRIRSGSGKWAFLWLGVCVGIAILAKYSAALFLLPMTVATVSLKEYRIAVVRRELFLSLLAAIAITGPHLVVAFGRMHEVRETLHQRANVTDAAGAASTAAGLLNVAISLGGALIGAIVISLICRPQRSAENDPTPPESPDIRALLARFLLTSAIMLVVFTVALGARRVPQHWIGPALLLAPIWLLAHGMHVPRKRLVSAAGILMLAASVIVLCRAEPLLHAQNGKVQPRDNSFDELAMELKATGLDALPILAMDPVAGGYIKLHMPHARIIDAGPGRMPEMNGEKCTVVWSGATPQHLEDLIQQLGFDRDQFSNVQYIIKQNSGPRAKQHYVGYLILSR